MMYRRTFIATFVTLGLAGCSLPMTQRSAPRPVMDRSYDLREFRFQAPSDLKVSESESYYPTADVVWRGDPQGPRVSQIRDMFEYAVDRNRGVVVGRRPIDLEVALVRFHGVTNRTRYSVGGVYNIVFDLTVRDAMTGAVIEPTRRVVGNLDAPGGEEAVRLEQSGQTEKVRVRDFLTGFLRSQLV